VPTQITPITTIIVLPRCLPAKRPPSCPSRYCRPSRRKPFGTARQGWCTGWRGERRNDCQSYAQPWGLRAVFYFVAGGLWADTSVVIAWDV
jgi:hypothetical protein